MVGPGLIQGRFRVYELQSTLLLCQQDMDPMHLAGSKWRTPIRNPISILRMALLSRTWTVAHVGWVSPMYTNNYPQRQLLQVYLGPAMYLSRNLVEIIWVRQGPLREGLLSLVGVH